eukprot:8485256-Pyramimonas_sp.AAC.1
MAKFSRAWLTHLKTLGPSAISSGRFSTQTSFRASSIDCGGGSQSAPAVARSAPAGRAEVAARRLRLQLRPAAFRRRGVGGRPP